MKKVQSIFIKWVSYFFKDYNFISLNMKLLEIAKQSTSILSFFYFSIFCRSEIVKMLILKYPFLLTLMFMVSPILGTPLFELMLRPQLGNYEFYNMNVSIKFHIIIKVVLVIHFIVPICTIYYNVI